MFFTAQTAMSAKELAEKQTDYCKEHNLGLSTKITDLVHTTKIGCISGANAKLAVEIWH